MIWIPTIRKLNTFSHVSVHVTESIRVTISDSAGTNQQPVRLLPRYTFHTTTSSFHLTGLHTRSNPPEDSALEGLSRFIERNANVVSPQGEV